MRPEAQPHRAVPIFGEFNPSVQYGYRPGACAIVLDGGQELFPHIYGPLNLEAVIRILNLAPDSEGSFVIPKAMFGHISAG